MKQAYRKMHVDSNYGKTGLCMHIFKQKLTRGGQIEQKMREREKKIHGH